MNIQEYVDQSVKAMREKSFAESDQLSLGELIAKIEAIGTKYKSYGDPSKEENKHIYFDFGSLVPFGVDSWRGIYRELAIGYRELEDSEELVTVWDFLSILKAAIGETFTGYKGGDFTMDKDTPIWVSNYGNADNTAVINVVDDGFRIIIITSYRES